MPKSDYDAGRQVGIHEGRRMQAEARRWTDLIIMAMIVGAVVLFTQAQRHSAERVAKEADVKTVVTNRNAYEGCVLRNRIVERQIAYYLEDAQIEKGNRFVDDLLRKQRVEARESVARDIRAIGVRDCTVYLKTASPLPSPK